MRFFIFSILTLLFIDRAQAIIDIETLRMQLHNSPYGGLVTLSYNRKQGNSDTNRLSAGLQGLWKKDDFEYLASFSREFGESNGARDTDRTVGHLRVTYPTSSVFQAEVFGQLEQDQFRRLSDRTLSGADLRIELSRDKDFLANVGAGMMWSKETLAFAPGTTDTATRESFRGDFYLSLRKKIAEGIAFSTVTYYQPVLTRLDDAWVFDDNELTFEPSESSLSLSLVYQLTYQSRPPQTVQPSDQTFGSILRYKF